MYLNKSDKANNKQLICLQNLKNSIFRWKRLNDG